MFDRIHPRLQMFVRSTFYGVLGIFAFVGAKATYLGNAELEWPYIGGWITGCALAALSRNVPKDILAAHQRAQQEH